MEGVRELLAAIDSFRTRVFSWIINGGHAVDIKAVEDGSDFDAHFADEEDDDNCCSICTEPMTTDGDILRLPCNDKHAFHLACIREWAGVNLSCPLDRKPIPPEVLVQLSPFNSVRLHASIFLEAMLSGTVQYLQYTHIWFDFPVNFISMAVNKCSTAWVRQIERSLYTHEELPHEDGVDGEARRVMLLPEFLRPAVRLTSKVTFHALLWTAYSSIGYTSIVLHYLVRQIVEQQGHRICMQAIGLANVGYDYAGTKPLLAKTQLASFLKGIGFLLGLVVVGRKVRRCSHDLASHVLGQLHQALSIRA